MTIFDVIEKWSLSDQRLDFKRFTRGQISLMATDIRNCYAGPLHPAVGRFHHSLATATEIVEGRKPVEELAMALLFSKQLLLPDPLYSVLSVQANSTWNRLPESGNQHFWGGPAIYSQWKSYWSTRHADRVDYLNKCIPALVTRLMMIRPLIDANFVTLLPWEIAVGSELDALRAAVFEFLDNTSVVKEITQRYRQGAYHMGIRVGAISMEVSEDRSNLGLKKGQSMWVMDKRGILLTGLIHSLLASRHSSNFIDTLPGDRVVFDYVRCGGLLKPEVNEVVNGISVPNLASSLWPDIVAIKKDSELLSTLQEKIAEIAYCAADDQVVLIREAISELEAKISQDASIRKRVKTPASTLVVGVVAGMASSLATGSQQSPAVMAIGGMIGGGAQFLRTLASDYFSKERQALRKRRDLVVSVKSRIDSNVASK